MLDIPLYGLFLCPQYSLTAPIRIIFALARELASVVVATDRQPFFLSAIATTTDAMKTVSLKTIGTEYQVPVAFGVIRRIVGIIFADTVSIIIAAIGAVVAFMAAAAFDDTNVAAITATVSLPWMLRSLYIGQKGGAL